MLDPEDWIVYKFINLINGQGYIGQDKSGHRLSDHLWCANQGCPNNGCGGTSALHAAIRREGIESFDYEILRIGFSCQAEIDEVENGYILEYETLKPQGYNKTLNSMTPGRWGGEAPEEFERILDYLPPEKEQAIKEGMQIIEPQKGNTGRKTPDWVFDRFKIQKILLRSFPKLHINSRQRMRAERWALVIYWYFRLNYSLKAIAEELGITPNNAHTISAGASRVAQGYRADGRGKLGQRPLGRPRKIEFILRSICRASRGLKTNGMGPLSNRPTGRPYKCV